MSRSIGRGLCASLFCAALFLAHPATAQEKDSGKELLDQTRRLNDLAAQRLENDIRKALQEAQRLAATDVAKAVEVLKHTITRLEDDTVLTESRRDSLKRMLKDRIRATEVDAKAAADRADENAGKKALETGRRADEDRRVAEQEKINRELKDVRKLQEDGKTDEAARRAEELSRRNPENPATTASSRSTGTAASVIEARRMQAERDRRVTSAYRDIERSAMPPIGDIEFPKDWAEKTKKREVVRMTAKERAIMKALDSTVNVSFPGSRFDDVIEYLQTVTGQTIIVDKQALDDLQITYETPVTMKARSVTVRTVLRKILADLGLAYIVKDETIQIMSAAKAKETMTVRTYYLGDLVTNFDLRFGPFLNALQTLQAANQLIDFIQNTIDKQSWAVNGGQGTIAFDPRTLSLVVKQSAEIHFMLGR